MTCVTRKSRNRHTAHHRQRETSALESARQNRYTDPLHTASADRRHTTATELLARGASIDVVKELLGHASIRSTEVYMHPGIDAQRAAVDRLGPLRFGEAAP